MHSGQLPGYPASHGCIRLPYDFSALLFDATSKGGTVVIGDGKTPQPHLASNPGLMLAPKDFTPSMLRPFVHFLNFPTSLFLLNFLVFNSIHVPLILLSPNFYIVRV